MSLVIPASGTKLFNKAIGFDGSAGNGAVGAVTIATVTGVVLIEKIVPYNATLLSSGGSPTLALGVTGSTSLFVAATNHTALDGSKLWTSTTPTAAGVAIPAAMKDVAVDSNVIVTVAVAAVSGGIIRFSILWRPLSTDGKLV